MPVSVEMAATLISVGVTPGAPVPTPDRQWSEWVPEAAAAAGVRPGEETTAPPATRTSVSASAAVGLQRGPIALLLSPALRRIAACCPWSDERLFRDGHGRSLAGPRARNVGADVPT